MNEEKPKGYLVVIDNREFPSLEIEPLELFPARFHTREEAENGIERYKTWTREHDYSVFEGSIPSCVRNGDKLRSNPEYLNANFELRAVSAAWAEKHLSF